MRDAILSLLGEMVAYDTRNPPRAIVGDAGIFPMIADRLSAAGCDVTINDLGDGSVNLYAERGHPSILFNVHLDTVPADATWSADPHVLRIKGNHAIGLGACDIKGAAAALIAAIESRADAPAAVLFSSDEEAGPGRCVLAFLDALPFEPACVIVAEPTECSAVLGHRGLRTVEGVFHGEAGHASKSLEHTRSAIHAACQWVTTALEHASGFQEPDAFGMKGLRFNTGVIEGGLKANMIASRARVVFGMRPRPGDDANVLLKVLCNLGEGKHAEWTQRYCLPSLIPTDASVAAARALNLQIAEPVDFGTEAALFAAAGLPAIVLGPGNIAQAHTADEWVAIEQLERACTLYSQVMTSSVSLSV
ncbi:MAG: acetylornithine deacetylase [Phycisphaerales bacterium]